jgi:predicted alpha/beta hydrolase
MASPAPLDLRRPSLQHPARALADVLRRKAPALIWRALHPLQRASFDEGGAPALLRRAEVRTDDGWTLPVFALPARPGGSHEPVLLLHTLGLGPDSFRYGRAGTLASELTARGLQVYTACVRGDREAVPPTARAPVRFDDMAVHDLPALVEAVLLHARAERCHVVGHGFGGQLALGWVARCGDERLASLAVLSSPVRFPGALPGGGWAVPGWVPSHLPCPTRRLAALAAPWLDPDAEAQRRSTWRGPRLRGVLSHAAEDVPAGLLRQLLTWYREGALVDEEGVLDYGLALGGARAPLWVAVAPGDTWCPPEAVRPLAELWGGDEVVMHGCPDDFGHLDLVLHPDAVEHLFTPLAAWLSGHGARVWAGAGEVGLGARAGP